MARVLALIPDLLFGSHVNSALAAAGHDVRLFTLRSQLPDTPLGEDVLIVDLTGELDGPGLLGQLTAAGQLEQTATLGFYSHVDRETRERALTAGFDLVVPRSRMARESPQLVSRLAGQPPPRRAGG